MTETTFTAVITGAVPVTDQDRTKSMLDVTEVADPNR
jgi:hypothetical protein